LEVGICKWKIQPRKTRDVNLQIGKQISKLKVENWNGVVGGHAEKLKIEKLKAESEN
jgi:hypothetical protein